MSDISLVIGDAHVDPSQLKKDKLRRFRWLRNLIEDRPTIKRLIIIGDFLSMSSLSEWDKDKRRIMEGRRYLKDVEAGNKALAYLDDFSFEKIYVMGNHEEWVQRYVDKHPEGEGMYDLVKDLNLKERGYKVIPYKEDYRYKGTSFTHVPIQANGKPVTDTKKALGVYSNSVVFGHTHKLDLDCIHRKNSTSLQQGINCGCFFEHVDDYAKGSMTNYWRGVLLLDHYDYNRADIAEQWSLGRLKRVYGP